MTKREEMRQMLQHRTRQAILLRSANMADRITAEIVRQQAEYIAVDVAWAITEEYAFLELADIMEWKRTRVKR